jgi:hypothetical protein
MIAGIAGLNEKTSRELTGKLFQPGTDASAIRLLPRGQRKKPAAGAAGFGITLVFTAYDLK